MRSPLFAIIFLLTLTSAATAAPGTATADAWQPVRFLVGIWTGTGGGEGPGQGTGTTSFQWDLDQHVLVRRDHTELPKTAERPASTHDALMIVSKNPGGDGLRASYFDAGGHVIQYALVAGSAAGTAQFLSDPGPGPRFRLTYQKTEKGDLTITFEMAPPTAPDAFRPVTIGTVHRKAE